MDSSRDTGAGGRDLVGLLRRAGAKVTPQRLAVFEAVAAATNHPSPEEVCAAVRRRMPTISLATVYKTLEKLEVLDLVVRVPNAGETRRYDARMEPHHHLVCTGCGSIADWEDPAFEDLAPSAPMRGFHPTRITVQVQGLCEVCAADGRDDG